MPASGKSAGASGSNDKTGGAPGPVGPGESGTNRQEQDVAEADIAQTDGRTVVSLRNGRLRVFTVDDGRPRGSRRPGPRPPRRPGRQGPDRPRRAGLAVRGFAAYPKAG